MSQPPFDRDRPSADASPSDGPPPGSAWRAPTPPPADPFAATDGGPGVPPPDTNPVNVPNALTVLRLVLVPVFAWMLLAHPYDFGWRIAATAVFVAAMFTDVLDGYLARKHNIITSFGKIADPIADKALTGMAFIGLSIIGELLGEQPYAGAAGAAWWVTIIILIREWGITLMRILVLRTGVVLSADKGGKLKTVVQSAALVASLLPLMQPFKWVAWILVIAALILTVVTGVRYTIAMVRALRRRPGSSAT